MWCAVWINYCTIKTSVTHRLQTVFSKRMLSWALQVFLCSACSPCGSDLFAKGFRESLTRTYDCCKASVCALKVSWRFRGFEAFSPPSTRAFRLYTWRARKTQVNLDKNPQHRLTWVCRKSTSSPLPRIFFLKVTCRKLYALTRQSIKNY